MEVQNSLFEIYLKEEIKEETNAEEFYEFEAVEFKDEFNTENIVDELSTYENENVENSSDHKDSEEKILNKRESNPAESSSSDAPFCCRICSESFRDKCDLSQHMSLHSNEMSFNEQIDSGDEQITNSKVLSGEKPQCDTCSKSFTLNCHLKGHLLSHLDKKLNKCDICSKLFTNKCDLNRHLRIHSGE